MARIVTFQIQGALLARHVVFTIEQIYEGVPGPSRAHSFSTDAERIPPIDKNREGIQEIVASLGINSTKGWRPIFTCFLRGCSVGATADCVLGCFENVLQLYFFPKGPYQVNITCHGNGKTTASVSYKVCVSSDPKKTLVNLGKAVKKLIASGLVFGNPEATFVCWHFGAVTADSSDLAFLNLR